MSARRSSRLQRQPPAAGGSAARGGGSANGSSGGGSGAGAGAGSAKRKFEVSLPAVVGGSASGSGSGAGAAAEGSTSGSGGKARKRARKQEPGTSASPFPDDTTASASTSAVTLSIKGKGKGKGRLEPLAGSQTPPFHLPPQPVDRLSILSPELLSLIFGRLPTSSLPNLALVCKGLLSSVQSELYREVTVDARTKGHSIHRALHSNAGLGEKVRHITADVGAMAKTSSQWMGWFLYHSLHSLSGIIGASHNMLSLVLFIPPDGSAWTASLCSAMADLPHLIRLEKDLDRSPPLSAAASIALASSSRRSSSSEGGYGADEGMDIGWKGRPKSAMWCVSEFLKPMQTFQALTVLRLCGLSSDSGAPLPLMQHSCKLEELVLVEVNITNTDMLHIIGSAQKLRKLVLWRSSLLSKRGLTHVLKRCPALVELSIGGSWFGSKDEDDTNFPLDTCLPTLKHLRILHISGTLISPAIFTSPTTNLTHLRVSQSTAFTPQAVHSALAKMTHVPTPPVQRLKIREMEIAELDMRAMNAGAAGGSAGGGTWNIAGGGTSSSSRRAAEKRRNDSEWNDKWVFAVRAIAEAKGLFLECGDDDPGVPVVGGGASGSQTRATGMDSGPPDVMPQPQPQAQQQQQQQPAVVTATTAVIPRAIPASVTFNRAATTVASTSNAVASGSGSRNSVNPNPNPFAGLTMGGHLSAHGFGSRSSSAAAGPSRARTSTTTATVQAAEASSSDEEDEEDDDDDAAFARHVARGAAAAGIGIGEESSSEEDDDDDEDGDESSESDQSQFLRRRVSHGAGAGAEDEDSDEEEEDDDEEDEEEGSTDSGDMAQD